MNQDHSYSVLYFATHSIKKATHFFQATQMAVRLRRCTQCQTTLKDLLFLLLGWFLDAINSTNTISSGRTAAMVKLISLRKLTKMGGHCLSGESIPTDLRKGYVLVELRAVMLYALEPRLPPAHLG